MHYWDDPSHAELVYLNFHPLEVLSRYREPQLQVGENCSCVFDLRPKHWQMLMIQPTGAVIDSANKTD